MIEKIGHYSFTNPACVYDEEALTALELAARTAGKVNEVITVVNETVKNIENVVTEAKEAIGEALENGEFGELVITDEAVTSEKLAKHIRPVDVHFPVAVMNKPLLAIDLDAMTVTVNKEHDEAFTIYTRGESHTFKPSEVSANITDFLEAGSTAFSVYYDPESKTFFVASFDDRDIAGLKDKLFLGRMNNNKTINTLKIPVTVSGVFYGAGIDVNEIPDMVKPVYINMHRFSNPDNVVLNFNPDNSTLELVEGGTYNLYLGNKVVPLNFDEVSLEFEKGTGDVRFVIFDPVENKITFASTFENCNPSCIYLGVFNRTEPHKSDCLIPISLYNRYIYNPRGHVRENATLYVEYANADFGGTTPYIIYGTPGNSKLVFPSVRAIYAVTSDSYHLVAGESGGEPFDYEITFDDNSLRYLVAGDNGFYALSAKRFTELFHASDVNYRFFLGTINPGIKQHNLNFDCVEGASVTIMGDSISAGGVVHGGGSTYYETDRQNMWWDKVCRRCGLFLKYNYSSSGRKISELASTFTHDSQNVIMLIGFNDWIENTPLATFKASYETAIKQNYGKARVFVCTLFPFGRDAGGTVNKSWKLTNTNANGNTIAEFNEAIREVAHSIGAEVIELDSVGFTFRNASAVMHDWDASAQTFLHPNSVGHSMIAEKVCQYIKNGRNTYAN